MHHMYVRTVKLMGQAQTFCLRSNAFVANDEQKKIALESGAIFAGLEDLILKIEENYNILNIKT